MGLNIVTYGASKKKIEGVASGFDHAVKTGDNSFTMYFNDGSSIDLDIPMPVEVQTLSIDANSHLICTLSDGTNVDCGELPTAKVSELTDVSLNSLADGQTLVYNATTNKWVNKVAEGSVKVSEKTGNDIETLESQADPNDDGIYLKVPVKGVQIDSNDLTADSNDKVNIKVDNKTVNYDTTDGLEVKIDPDTNNAIKQNADGLFVSKSGIKTDNVTIEEDTTDGLRIIKSNKGNNDLEVDNDGTNKGLYVNVPIKKIVADTLNELQADTDGTVTLVSTNANNLIEFKTDGLFAEIPISSTTVPSNAISMLTDGLYVADKKIMANATNELQADSDGKIILISTTNDNALTYSAEVGKEGLFVAKGSIDNDDTNMTYDTLFDASATETDPYHGALGKQVNSDYLYKQFAIVIDKVKDAISDTLDLTSNIQYVTVDTYADLEAIDLSTYTSGVVLFLVKQDEHYTRNDGNAEYYTTIYIMIPKTDPTQNAYSFVAKLNMSEKLIENAFRKALFVEYYTPTTSGTTNAKVIVADGTLVDANTEVELSTVTSATILPSGTTVNIGDYVLFVDAENSTVTKFVKRSEIDVTVVSKLSVDTDGDLNYNGNKIAVNDELYKTQAEYDALPSSKDSDNIKYFVN